MIALLLRDSPLVLFFRENKLDPNLEVFPLSSYCVSGFSSCLEQVLIREVRYFIFKNSDATHLSLEARAHLYNLVSTITCFLF